MKKNVYFIFSTFIMTIFVLIPLLRSLQAIYENSQSFSIFGFQNLNLNSFYFFLIFFLKNKEEQNYKGTIGIDPQSLNSIIKLNIFIIKIFLSIISKILNYNLYFVIYFHSFFRCSAGKKAYLFVKNQLNYMKKNYQIMQSLVLFWYASVFYIV